MDFLSYKFIFFLILTPLVFQSVKNPVFRKWFLLLASFAFYYFVLKEISRITFAWQAAWILAPSFVVFFCARINTKASFYFGLIFTLAVFLSFKYISLPEFRGVKLLAPIGLSFYSFRLISYLADVRKGDIPPEKDLVYFLIYVSFFPLVICGPIQRASDFLPQLRIPKRLDWARTDLGLKQIFWGLVKKAVIADNLAALVKPVFAQDASFGGCVYILAVIAFSVQIYCDFSGYSDIAIGLARLFGFDIKENFRVPYCSTTLKEFWSRWHISLSTWFRDYVYFPLGGGRCGKFRRSINVMITFLLSGLWHGSTLNFIFWGGLHGLGLVMEKLFFPDKTGPKHMLTKVLWAVFVVFLVLFGWLFFKAESFSQANMMLTASIQGIDQPLAYVSKGFSDLLGESNGIIFIIKLVIPGIFIFVVEHCLRNKDIPATFAKMNVPITFLFYLVTLIFILLFHAMEQQELIYGKF